MAFFTTAGSTLSRTLKLRWSTTWAAAGMTLALRVLPPLLRASRPEGCTQGAAK